MSRAEHFFWGVLVALLVLNIVNQAAHAMGWDLFR